MENVLYQISYIISGLFELYLIAKFFYIFLGPAAKEKRIVIMCYLLRLAVCTVQYAYLPYAFVNMLTVVGSLFFLALCYGGKITQKIIAVVLVFICLFASEAIVAGILLLLDNSLSVNGYNGDVFTYLSISIVLWIIYEIVSSFKNINTETVLPKTINVIMVVLSIILASMETMIFMQPDIMDSVKVQSVICVFLVLFLIIYLYDFISKYYVQRLHTEMVEREKNYYLKQVELLEQGNQEIRDLRHDMKNHLFAIASMITDENEDAKKYIANITEKIETNEIYSSTGNVAVDSVINYKLSKANQLHIETKLNISIPSNIQEGVEDLVTIIGNLLDNAIEASEKLEKDRCIEMKVKYKRGIMFIDVKNRYDGIVKQKKGEIITQKEDQSLHGIGLKSVASAVRKHDGRMGVEYDEKEFWVSILLYI